MRPDEKLSSDFQTHQRAMARICLSKAWTELPGATSAKRVEVYRDLVFGGFKDTLDKAFPIAKRVLGPKEWSELVSKFVSEYPCESPQLWKMPQGLLEFVTNTGLGLERHPFLRDLLEFEWVEIEVQMMMDVELPKIVPSLNPWDEILVVNPEHRVSVLEYPVFQLGVDQLRSDDFKRHKGTYFLLTYRHPETDIVKYMQISPIVLSVLDKISSQKLTWRQAFEAILKDSNLEIENSPHMDLCDQALRSLLVNGAILGKAA